MDEDFKNRMNKIHEDHARFMALVESMPPLTDEQKAANRAKQFAEEEPIREAKRQELAQRALQGDPNAKHYPLPEEIFPPLPWRPRVLLNLARIHWKANIELCKRIGSMMRQFRHYSKWLSKNAPLGSGLSSEALEPMNDMGDLIYSHLRAVQSTKRVTGPECIPAAELLDMERQLAALYRVHRNQWTPEYRAELKAERDAQEIKMAPTAAMVKDMMNNILKDADG
jgi:hypothetical protein